MNMKEMALNSHPSNEKYQLLQKELDAALELIKNYEAIINDLQNENRDNLKKFSHDLSNPLQILYMTVESLLNEAPTEMQAPLERIQRSTEIMVKMLAEMRKLGRASSASSAKIQIV